MEIVKYIKVIIPGLRTKKVSRSTFWHMLQEKICRCVSVWGLNPRKTPQTPPMIPNEQLVSGNMCPSTYVSGYKLLVRDTCCRAICCPGVNAA